MFRLLNYNDYYKGYLELLNQLTEVGNVSYDQFVKFVDTINDDHQIWVYCENDKILVTGTLFKSQKLIHSYSKYGFIEEIVVDKSLRGLGFGKKIVEFLRERGSDCYRINLGCKSELIPFYQKCGFTPRSTQMVNIK